MMKNIFQFLKPYICKNKKHITFYILAAILLWAANLIIPYAFGIYIDYLVAKISVSILVTFVVVIAFVKGFQVLSTYITSLLSTKYNNTMVNQIHNDTYQRIFGSKLSNYINVDKSYLIDQIRTDSESLTQFFTNNVTNVVLQFITIVASGTIVFKSDKLLCGIIFCLVPIYVLIYVGVRKKMYAANSKFKDLVNEYFSKCAEQINKLEFVKRHVLMKEMYQRIQTIFQTLYGIVLILMKTDFLFRNLGEFVSVLCYIFVLGIGGYRVFQNELSIGHFTMINTYFTMIISSASYFLDIAKDYQQAKIAAERFAKINETDYELYGSRKIETLDRIELKSCSMSYCSDFTVFDQLSYDFEKGKIYGILGHNGAGKTTLLNCLIGLYNDLIVGDFLFDGIPILELDMPDLRRRQISLVEQFPEFLNLSIEEYLSLGVELDGEKKKWQEELIREFQLDQFIAHTDIKESGNNFSGGEKQKLSIVRALCKQGFLTILDEPTSALDHASVETLIRILQKQKRDTITLVVTHDIRILDICDETLDLTHRFIS